MTSSTSAAGTSGPARTTTSGSSGGAGNPAGAAAILTIILVSYFMILLDNSVVFTGLPSIRTDLDLSPSGLSWVQDAYVLVFGGLLLLGARAGDLIGRRKLFVIGLAIFGAASLLIGLSPSGELLIAGRAVQGIGAAIVAPTSLSLITAHFEGPARARAVALYAATAGIGASLGLLVGGAMTELVSWRAAFLINVPIAAAMVIAARRVLAETPRQRGRFDIAGALLATTGMAALVFGIIESSQLGWSSPAVLVALVLGVALLVALVVVESRAAQPIMPLRLFASRERSSAYGARALYMGAMIGFFFFTTQYLQDGLGFSPLQAGLGFLPMSLVNFAVAMAVPRLRRCISGPLMLTAGIAVTLAGTLWLAQATTAGTYLLSVAAPMVLIGIGQGLAFAPLTDAGIAGVAARDAGAASGLVNTSHQLGTALGLAVLSAVAVNASTGLASVAAVQARLDAALSTGSVLLAAALVIVLVVLLPARRVHRAAPVATAPTSSTPSVASSTSRVDRPEATGEPKTTAVARAGSRS